MAAHQCRELRQQGGISVLIAADSSPEGLSVAMRSARSPKGTEAGAHCKAGPAAQAAQAPLPAASISSAWEGTDLVAERVCLHLGCPSLLAAV